MRWRIVGRVARAGMVVTGAVSVRDGRTVADDPGARVVVLPAGWLVAPGLVDLQVNGFAGNEIGPDPAACAHVAAALPARGVTAFCPTVVTRRWEDYADVARTLAATRWPAAGARALGPHLEGPFLAPSRAGAHEGARLRRPAGPDLEWLLDAFRPAVVTLAPEVDGGLAAIGRIARSGAVAAVGHTEADAALGARAIDAGARLLTHALNAMRPLGGRDPGAVAAFLADPRVHLGAIADGVHLAPATLAVLARAAAARLLLVSDSVAAAGVPPGRSVLAGRPVTCDGVRVTDAEGRLAGSAAGLDAGPPALMAAGLTAGTAIAAATDAPRRLLGLPDPLAPGAEADLVVLDTRLRVRATLIGGRPVHDPGGLLGRPQAG
ncbi:MAG: amidohydrolase family protein [Miltoncostaeaceae bacterium]